MKYGATIQDLAAKGLNWRFYDEKLVQRSRKPLSTLESLSKILVFQGVFVLLTMGVVTVWAVPLGMIVSNVRVPTLL